MAIVNFTGFEQGTDTAYEVNQTTGSGFAYSSTTPHTGTYSLQQTLAADASTGYIVLAGYDASGTAGAFNLATIYVQFYFRYATKPSSGSETIFWAFEDTGGTQKFAIRLDSAGKLNIYNTANTQIGSAGATTLSANTWYKINVSVGTGAAANYEVLIDDASEFSGTANLNTNNNVSIRLGKVTNTSTQAIDWFFDDVVIDDAAYPAGDAIVKPILPIANGSVMTWTGGTGSSNYAEVDEVPYSDADYVQSLTSGAPNNAQFDMTSTSTAGISGTILSVKCSTRTRENTSVSSSTNGANIWSGASVSSTTAFNGNTSVTSKTLLQNTNPSGGGSWSTSSVDALEMGVIENNNVAVRCTNVLGNVLYIPSSTPAANSNFLFFMPN